MTVAVDLQGSADKQVHRVLAGQLAEHPVGAHRTVAAGEEHIRARGDVVLHAQFGAKAMHAFHPAAFDGRDQRRVRVEGPVAADLALQAEGFTVGGQDQFDGSGVEADAMVEGLHIVFFVDAADRHHRHQHMHRLDMARVAGEQRLDVERLVGHHHKIHPTGGDVDAGQIADVIHQLVDLHDHDAIAERGGFDQRRSIFGAGAGVDISGTVGHETGGQYNVGDQVHHQPCIELDVSVDSTDFQQAVFEQLADAQGLGAGEGKVQLARDALFKQIQVLGPPDAGHDHVQIVELGRVGLGQGAREEVGLLLVVAFQHHAVAGEDQRLKRFDDPVAGQHRPVCDFFDLPKPPLLLVAPPRPARVGGYCCCHGRSTGLLSWAVP